jgi:acrylyl-CoA reductase (NADPH)
MNYGSSVAAVGLAGGSALPASVIPFLLRGINLLGIDSVMQPAASRIRAWDRIACDLPAAKLEVFTRTIALKDVPDIGAALLASRGHGRYVVDMSL